MTQQADVRLDASPHDVCRALRGGRVCSLLLEGGSEFDDAWNAGPLVAVDPAQTLRASRGDGMGIPRSLEALDRLIAERRAVGGTGATGVAVLLSYDSFEPPSADATSELSELVALTVDHTIRFAGDGTARITVRGEGGVDAVLRRVTPRGASEAPAAARPTTRPVTSLPREDYLRAVSRVKRHIERGDVYQANLCQRFDADYEGDPFETYAALSRETPAPRSAFLETPELALASVSPETFLRVSADGVVETWPIKGTRPRGRTPEEDSASARELETSEKDRAELLMIVDLERNDLSRVCRAGSVEVPLLAGLQSYAAVHHLVAHVRGTLTGDVAPSELIRATFPGGSITGAPKIRARQILRELEPVRRGYFTGSLFWFGDDGTLDSSILIRSWVFAGRRAWLGAGGGIVADSDPEQEWQESNHKARALAAALGFDPEDAG